MGGPPSARREVESNEGANIIVNRDWCPSRFGLEQDGDSTAILFEHQGWKEPVESMHHCSTKWAIFLMSLKSLVETGKGAPYPNDTLIDNWR